MNDDDLDALRAEVDRHTGPARAQPLTALGQALAQQYWRVGPGSSGAAPHLDEAIRVFDEAYGYLEAGEFPRGMLASWLGWLLGIRHVAHGSPADDRERGIALLDEALGFPQLPPMLQLLARVVLGQLLMSRVTRSMQSPDFMMRAMGSGLSADDRASADRAVDCFREVVDAPAASAELAAMARTMLGLAETLQMMAGGLGGGLAGGVGGIDLGRMMQAMANLQNLQQQAAAPSSGTGFGRLPNLFEFAAGDLATLDPLKRPVTVVEGAVPAASSAPPPSRGTQPRPAEPAGTFRDAFFALVPGRDFGGLQELLDRPAAGIDVDTVDRLVGLATSLVRTDDAIGTDHLLLAVALYLRSVVDPGGGWGEDADVDELGNVRTTLLTAADAIVGEEAESVVVAFRLATFLDERRSAQGVRNHLAERFADVVKALRTVGADGLLYASGDHRLLLSGRTGSLAPAGSDLPGESWWRAMSRHRTVQPSPSSDPAPSSSTSPAARAARSVTTRCSSPTPAATGGTRAWTPCCCDAPSTRDRSASATRARTRAASVHPTRSAPGSVHPCCTSGAVSPRTVVSSWQARPSSSRRKSQPARPPQPAESRCSRPRTVSRR